MFIIGLDVQWGYYTPVKCKVQLVLKIGGHH